MDASRLLEDLDPDQRRAVVADPLPTLVMAGAGSGKTRVLTYRIAHQIATGVVEPRGVMASTFTKNAAAEMRGRVEALLGRGAAPAIATFHSLMFRMLNNEAELRGGRRLDVCRESERTRILRGLIGKRDQEFPDALNLGDVDIKELGAWISSCKNTLVHADDDYVRLTTLECDSDTVRGAAARVYPLYEAHLAGAGKLDFDDMLLHAYDLLTGDEDTLRRCQRRWLAFFGDEGQDLNTAQWRIVQLVAPATNAPNLTVVGDSKQCVPYGQRIATPDGDRFVQDIEPGDVVLASVEGKAVPRAVLTVSQTRKQTAYEFTTATGKTFQATPDHLLFASVPITTVHRYLYVYLMYREGFGFRVGMMQPRGGAIRTIMENADRLWLLDAFEDDKAARRLEHRLAYLYGVPMTVFKYRPDIMFDDQEQVRQFHQEFAENGFRLLKDFQLDFDRPAYIAKSTLSGRVAVNLVAGAKGGCQVSVESAHIDGDTRALYGFTTGKSGTARYRRWFSDANTAAMASAAIAARVGGLVVESLSLPRSADNPRRRVFAMPAAGVIVGMLVPEVDDRGIVAMVPVVARRLVASETAFDLEVQGAANFIVGGVVVHNCLYSFRGAQPDLMDKFDQMYPGARRFDLVMNYRSTPQVIRAANTLIAVHGHPPQVPSRDGGVVVRAAVFADQLEQGVEIARFVEAMRACGHLGGDCAVLVRTNAQTAQIERNFVAAGLPYYAGGGGFLNRLEVGDLMAYLRLAQNREDALSLRRIINRPTRYLGAAYVDALAHHAAGGDLVDSMRTVMHYSGKAMTSRQVDEAMKLADLLDTVRSMRPDTAVRQVMTSTNYVKWLRKNEGVEAAADDLGIENIDALLELAAEFSTIPELLAYAEEAAALLQESGDATELCTVHRAKGREWPFVVVSNFYDNSFPHKSSTNPHEERRIAYVAWTRARDALLITVPGDDIYGAGVDPSPYLAAGGVTLDDVGGDWWGDALLPNVTRDEMVTSLTDMARRLA